MHEHKVYFAIWQMYEPRVQAEYTTVFYHALWRGSSEIDNTVRLFFLC